MTWRHLAAMALHLKRAWNRFIFLWRINCDCGKRRAFGWIRSSPGRCRCGLSWRLCRRDGCRRRSRCRRNIRRCCLRARCAVAARFPVRELQQSHDENCHRHQQADQNKDNPARGHDLSKSRKANKGKGEGGCLNGWVGTMITATGGRKFGCWSREKGETRFGWQGRE